MTMNTMDFTEFLKAILALGWIIAGFIIFFKEINAEDPLPSQPASSTIVQHVHQHQTVIETKQTSIDQKTFLSQSLSLMPPVSSDDDVEETINVMKQIIFFSQPIHPTHHFYDALTPPLKKEFNQLFIQSGPMHKDPTLVYERNVNEADFYAKLSASIYDYRQVISLPLMSALHTYLISLTKDKQSHTLIHQAFLRTAYTQRDKKPYLTYAETLAKQDYELHLYDLKSEKQYVYGILKFAIILEKQGRYQEALEVVEQALTHQLDDRTKGNYIARKERLLKQLQPPPVVDKIPVDKSHVEMQQDDEEENDDASLETIQIFKTTIQARAGFYEELTKDEKLEFSRYFIEQGPERLTEDIRYVIGGNNDMFFMRVFNYIYRYRKLISFSLLKKIYDELMTFTKTDLETQSILTELAIRVAYFRRKTNEFLSFAERLSRLDVQLHQQHFNTRNTYVYSFTRLAIILEKKKAFQEALDLVEDALKRGLSDKTRTEYAGRKTRLLKKLGEQK
jgi:hypothetical protein